MVAIFTGAGTGLENGSGSTLGGAGLVGGSSLGRVGENLFFNAANGNLVISQQDEFLVGRGPDVGISRTYNSQGTWDGDNNDNWQFAGKRRWHSYVAGVSVTRTGADGSDIVYSYVGADKYRAKAGGGAHDQLQRLSNGAWERTDGDSRIKETYDSGGNLINVADSDGNTVSYSYDYYNNGYRLVGVSTSDGSQVIYSYSGNNVTKITTSYSDLTTSTAKTLTRTYYGYDGSNRLSSVTTDLSPQNNSISDGKTYVTSYTYDGSSNRVASISQTDGSKLAMEYDAQGRVIAFVQTVAAGETRTTRIGYGVNVTSVTDPTDQVTKFYYDNDGQLIQLMSPPANQGGPAQVTQFEYDADGNVIRTIETDADNASAANNLVKASGWGDGEVAGRGENLVDDSGWPQDSDGTLPAHGTIGQGWTGSYTGETDWVKTTGPYGENIVSMLAGQEDAGDAGGGAVSNNFTVDKSKAYEYTLYLKADALDKHRAYFGLSSGVVKNGDNGVYNSNPYFTYDYPNAGSGMEAGKWYKVIGYVLPDGTATEAWGSHGGVYDIETGAKVRDIRHFIWDGTQSATTTYTRFFNFYNTDNQGKFTHFYKPEVRQVSDVAILRGDQKLDVDRDANLLNNPTADGWNNIPWANNDDEARWDEVVGPDGARQVALQTGEFDGTSSTGHDGGGGYTNQFTIDGSKTYKFTQYVRKSDLDKHSLYFGLSSHSTPYVKLLQDGAGSTNPYFHAWATGTQQQLLDENKWYKMVAYVLPEGTANAPWGTYGGIYDAETGQKVSGMHAYRWHENRPNDSVHARFFNYYDQTEHGWSTHWTAPEVVEVRNVDLAADNADPFGIVYDESAPETRFEYDLNGNVTKVIDPTGNVTTRTYNANNQMVTETVTGVNEHASITENTTPSLTPGNWSLSRLEQTAASTINGNDAQQFTISSGQTNGALYKYAGTVKAGDTVSFQISVKATGGVTSHMLGLWGNISGWGSNTDGESVGYVLDGPGEIVQSSAGYWYVSGLSETEATTIELRRTYSADQAAYPHFYVDYPNGAAGDAVILSNPVSTILRKDHEVVSATDITQWGHGGVTVADAGTLNGAPARKFTSAAGANWSATSSAFTAKKGETFVVDMTLQAVGSASSQSLGLYGSGGSGWGTASLASAKVISGPGTIAQAAGGLWTVSGLSTTAPTRIQVTRTYDRDESGGAYLYIDHPGGYRDGSALIAAAPKVTKFAANSTQQLTTRYVYDGENHLRYTVSAEGNVSEYYYLGNGQMYWQVDYPQAKYDIGLLDPDAALTETQLNNWRSALDHNQSKITYNTFDARGNLLRSINYSGSETNWGYADGADGSTYSYYTYDQTGNLLERHQLYENSERFVYDGLNRLIASSDLDGNATTIYFKDTASQTVVRLADGATNTSTFNKAGDLISHNESHVGHLSAEMKTDLGSEWYMFRSDRTTAGTLNGEPAYRFTTSAGEANGGTNTAGIAVSAGETVTYKITVQAEGGITDHMLGLYGNVSGWSNPSGTGNIARILDGPGTLSQSPNGWWYVSDLSESETTTIVIQRTYEANQYAYGYFYIRYPSGQAGDSVVLAAPSITKTITNAIADYNDTSSYIYDRNGRLRMETDATGHRSYFLYDKQGRKVADIDHNGSTVEYRYDDQGRVLSTTRFYHAVTAEDRNLLANPDNDVQMDDIRPDAAGEIWTWTVYDNAGRVLQDIDGDGRVTAYQYDNADRLIRTTSYYNQLTSTQIISFRDTPPEHQILPTAHAKDAIARTFYDRDGRVAGTLNSEGYLTRNFYDAAGQLIRETAYANPTSAALRANGTLHDLAASISANSAKDIVNRFVYDGQGHLRYAIDATLNVTSYDYNVAGRQTGTIVYAAPISSPGSDYSFTNIKAKVAAITDAADRLNTADQYSWTTYNSSGQIAYTVNAEGKLTGYEYDQMGRVIKTTEYADRYPTKGLVSEASWDNWVNVAPRVNNPGNRVTRNWYNGKGELRYSADAEGFVAERSYDAEGRLVSTIRYETAQSFSDTSLISSVSSAVAADFSANRYQKESFSYDAQGRVVNSYDGLNTRTHYWYRGNGELAYSSTATGTGDETVVFYRNFNQAGQITWDGSAHGEAEATNTYYYYDGHGNLNRVLDPNGNSTYYTHDKLGRVLTETDAEGGVSTYTYDAFGNAITVTDARGYTSYNYYNNENQLIETKDALNISSYYAYTSFGELATVTRAGAVTRFEYDKLGRVTKTIDAENHSETYVLDAFGNRAQVINKLGGVTTNTYDRRGLLRYEWTDAKAYDSSGGEIADGFYKNIYEYDSRGNMIRRIEAYGLAERRDTNYVYDKTDRLIQTISEGFNGLILNEYIKYDARGNITATIDPAGARTIFYYDDLGRKTVEVNGLGTYTAYTYDKNSNVTAIRVYENTVGVPADGGAKEEAPPAPSGGHRETTFTYDDVNRQLTSNVAGINSYIGTGSGFTPQATSLTAINQYDANGNLVKQTDANGNAVHFYYDQLGRKVAQVDQERFRTDWTYDAEGNVTRERRYINQAAAPAVGTPPTVTSGGTSDRITDYTYDKVGNRTHEIRYYVDVHNGSGAQSQQSSVVIHHIYNGLGQVTRKTEGTGEATNYAYDQTGRLTQEQKAAFDDYRPGATSVTPTTNYYYDGLNNLTMTRQQGVTGSIAHRDTRYIYNGGQLYYTTDASGFSRYYSYDSAGRRTYDYYARTNSPNSYEGTLTSYDLLGRVQEQRQVKHNGTSWSDSSISTINQYNAFGEVISISMGNHGAHGPAQIQNKYDKAGRLWASNSSGTWQYFAHDAAGNQTAVISSGGGDITGQTLINALDLAVQTNVNGTFTHYDKRGQAISVVEEGRQLNSATGVTLTSSRTYNAFGEVLSETDALNNTTNYTYNNMGRVIKKESPYVSVTSATGAASNVRPTENYYYDTSGRLVASRDANNNLTRLTLLAGTGYDGSEALVTQEIHADGGIKKTEYDRLGNARRMTDEENRVTTQNFDNMGRVIQITKPNNLNIYYTYDGLGQRLTEWNTQLTVNNKQTTDYDALGRVISSRAFGGDVTTKTYLWNGSLTTTGLGTFGGWIETTSTVADRAVAHVYAATETSDLFGNLITRSDASGQIYNYTYDVGGRLTLETSNLVGGAAWKHNSYSYYNTGQISQSVTGSLPSNTQAWTRKTNSYEYDALGRLKREKLVKDGGYITPPVWEPEFGFYLPGYYVPLTPETLQDGHATYDAAGRMTRYYDDAPSGAHNADKTWAYDAAGNVRKISSTYRPVNADGSLATSTATQEYWYAYDNMNRVVTTKGQLLNGQIVRGDSTSTTTGGIDILYNKAGERTQTIGSEYVFDQYIGYSVDRTETYTYNSDGQITQTRINNVLRGTTSFDLLGRVNGHAEYSAANVLAHERYGIVYDTRNQVIADKTKTRQGSSWLHTHTVNYYSAAGVGSHGGAITHYGQVGTSSGSLLHFSETKNWSSSSSILPGYLSGDDYAYADSYTTQSYRWSEGAQQATVHLVNRDGTSNSNYAYDKNDHLVSVGITGGNRPRTISFENTREGQILTRREADNNYAQNDPSQRTYSFGGKQMGTVGNDGTDNVDYDQSIINRTTVQGTGAFRNGATTGALYADFDQNYQAINGTSQQDTSNIYTAQGGESLAQVAAAVWGDSALWYKIAQANGLSGSETLIKGRTITIPSNVGGINHNAGTFKVYDPAEAIGDTSPNTPEPPKKSNKCGVFGQVVLVVIAAAVTAITAGKGAPLGLKIAAAALGSAVSQGVGVVTGIQNKFSFKSFALSVVSAGVNGGISELGKLAEAGKIGGGLAKAAKFLNGGGILSKFANGAVASAITQGVGVATGLQEKFSFAGVAAAGVGAVAGSFIGGKAASAGFGQVGSRVAATAASTLANAATRSAIEGSSFGDNIQRALPDAIGQLVGSILGEGIRTAFEPGKPENLIPEAFDNPVSRKNQTLGSKLETALGIGGPQESTTVSGDTGSETFVEGGTGTTTDAILRRRADPKFLNNLSKKFGAEFVVKDLVEELAYHDSVGLDKFQQVGDILEGYSDRTLDGAAILSENRDLDRLISSFRAAANGVDGYYNFDDVLHPSNHEVIFVNRGDTLTSIANSRKGLRVSDLAWLNGIDNPNQIDIGQNIKLPKQAYLEAGREARNKFLEQASGLNIIEEGGYSFIQDSSGATIFISGKLRLETASRNSRLQRQAGGNDRLESDEGGHFIAAQFGGPPIAANLFPQNSNFNRSAYRKFENSLARALRADKTVEIQIQPTYSGQRPVSLNVTTHINGNRNDIVFYNRPGGR